MHQIFNTIWMSIATSMTRISRHANKNRIRKSLLSTSSWLTRFYDITLKWFGRLVQAKLNFCTWLKIIQLMGPNLRVLSDSCQPLISTWAFRAQFFSSIWWILNPLRYCLAQLNDGTSHPFGLVSVSPDSGSGMDFSVTFKLPSPIVNFRRGDNQLTKS